VAAGEAVVVHVSDHLDPYEQVVAEGTVVPEAQEEVVEEEGEEEEEGVAEEEEEKVKRRLP